MNILFVQLPVPTFVPHQNTGNHLLAASSLVLHLANSGIPTDGIDILPQEICSRAGDTLLINTICEKNPGIVAFTCTVWNIERNMYIASEIKSRIPEIIIWFGGPEIAADSFCLHQPDPVFDLAIEGDGEAIFRLLYEGNDPSKINGIFIPGKLSNCEKLKIQPLIDLSTIHDPFLSGWAEMESDRVLVTELFRGCKYKCKYCRYHNSYNSKASIRPYNQVNNLFEWARENDVQEIFLLDPSFEQRPDIIPFLSFLSEVNKQPAIPLFAELRAESVDPQFARMLYKAGIRHVETGLQTISKKALQNAGRSFDRKKFTAGIVNLQKTGIRIRTDIMIGLPGDTPDDLKDTAQFLIDLGLAHSAQVFRTQILPGTGLRKLSQKFGISYEDKPPYQVLSTPAWTQSELDSAITIAEDLLNINCSPEERPFIRPEPENKPSYITPMYMLNSICYAYTFDSTTERGIHQLTNETFSSAANTFSVTIKVTSLDFLPIIERCLKCIVAENPFSAISIVLQIPSGYPIDVFDKARAILDTNIHSEYLSRLYPATYSVNPSRRLLSCIDIFEGCCIHYSWLEELRKISEIVWVHQFSNARELLSKISTFEYLEPEDYIFINVKILIDEDIELLTSSVLANQFIFSDLQYQWDFINTISS